MERIVLKSRGQVTLPAKVRKLLRLEEGDILELTVEAGRIVLTPLEFRPRVSLHPSEPGGAGNLPERAPANTPLGARGAELTGGEGNS